MSADDPSPGEIWRKLEALTDQIGALVERLERRDDYVEANYVRRDVWHANRLADQGVVANLQQDIGGIQKQQDTDRAWRRQLGLGVAVCIVTSLLTIVGLILSLVR